MSHFPYPCNNFLNNSIRWRERLFLQKFLFLRLLFLGFCICIKMISFFYRRFVYGVTRATYSKNKISERHEQKQIIYFTTVFCRTKNFSKNLIIILTLSSIVLTCFCNEFYLNLPLSLLHKTTRCKHHQTNVSCLTRQPTQHS